MISCKRPLGSTEYECIVHSGRNFDPYQEEVIYLQEKYGTDFNGVEIYNGIKELMFNGVEDVIMEIDRDERGDQYEVITATFPDTDKHGRRMWRYERVGKNGFKTYFV